MVNSSRWNVSGATLFQLAAEGFWVAIAVILVLQLRGLGTGPLPNMVVPAFVFALLMVLVQGAFGLYRRDHRMGLGTYVVRLSLAMVLVVPVAYLAADILPGGSRFREAVGDTVLLAFGGLIVVRYLVVSPVLKLVLPHRILVLGTGPEARMIEMSLASVAPPGVTLVGFYALDKIPDSSVSPGRIISRSEPLDETVRNLGIDEIIVAVREQRGGVLPLHALLDCRLAGVRITDLPRFFERVHGQIPIEALKASWLIYGSGFRQNWLRTTVKRTFDIVVSLVLVVLTFPIMLAAALVIALESGAPVIYRQERVGLHGRTFNLLKFRSMRKDAEKDGKPTWAAVGDARVTKFGRFMRRSRIDELPQLLNVLRGEMSFVGPRPERPVFVALLTEKIPFYAVRQSIKPGLTGWAQVRYAYGADVVQAMKKLEYDLYYVKNHTLFLDLLIMLETVRVVLLGQGAR